MGAILINQKRFAEAKKPLQQAMLGFEAIGPEGWGKAYPGNDPRIYAEGQQASIDSARQNLDLVERELSVHN